MKYNYSSTTLKKSSVVTQIHGAKCNVILWVAILLVFVCRNLHTLQKKSSCFKWLVMFLSYRYVILLFTNPGLLFFSHPVYCIFICFLYISLPIFTLSCLYLHKNYIWFYLRKNIRYIFYIFYNLIQKKTLLEFLKRWKWKTVTVRYF